VVLGRLAINISTQHSLSSFLQNHATSICHSKTFFNHQKSTMKVISSSALILVLIGVLCAFSIVDAAVSMSGSLSSDVFRFNYPKPGAVYDYDDVVWSHVEGQDGKDAELVRSNATLVLYVQRVPTTGLKGNSLKLFNPSYNQLSGVTGFYFSPEQRHVATDPRKLMTPFRMHATFMLSGKQQHVNSPTFFIRPSL
jgi:hypothetical protein